MDFWTSDLHLGHRLMVDKERYVSKYRNYNTVEEHDTDILLKINQKVKAGDNIYVIGDFSFHKPDVTRELLRRINANVILVKGNHDHRKKNSFLSMVEYADELAESHMYLERKFTVSGEDQLICMFHFPLMHWHKHHYGSWHLHGHLHGNPSGVPGKCMDVGWDAHGELLSLMDIAAIMATKPARGNHHEEKH